METGLERSDAATVIAETRAWVERAVIGLNLCPFAKAAQARGRTRLVCTKARDAEALPGACGGEGRATVAEAPAAGGAARPGPPGGPRRSARRT